ADLRLCFRSLLSIGFGSRGIRLASWCITRMCLLLDESCPQQIVDRAFEGAAPVVRAVDGAGQRDETRPKILIALAETDVVLNLPKLQVDRSQLLDQFIQARGVRQRVAAHGIQRF